MTSGRDKLGEKPRWLHRDAIVEAALVIADREGAEAVSMRRVARELGVGTMSLYHHVADKDELVYHMTDAIAAELLIPDEVPLEWREALRAIAMRTRAVFLRHPWLLDQALPRPMPTPNMLRHIEQSIAAVAGLDVDEHVAGAMVMAVDDYTIGFVVREVNARRWDEPVGLGSALRELIDSGELPHLARVWRGRTFRPPPAGRFEDGLEWLLDGMAAEVERATRRSRRASSA